MAAVVQHNSVLFLVREACSSACELLLAVTFTYVTVPKNEFNKNFTDNLSRRCM